MVLMVTVSGAAWEAARPAVCRTVGVSASPDEELGRLAARLDLAYHETAARVPRNPAVTIVGTASGPDLSVEALEKVDEPQSLLNLHVAIGRFTVTRTRLRPFRPVLLLNAGRTGRSRRQAPARERWPVSQEIGGPNALESQQPNRQ